MKKTLNEVIKEVGLTRRQIQEYEKYGTENDRDRSVNRKINKHHKPFTIQPKKENGKLMYDEDAVERLWLIKFYKELDYKKDDISKIFNDPEYDKEQSLNKAIEQLKEIITRIESLIDIAELYKSDCRPMWDNKFFNIPSFEKLMNCLTLTKNNPFADKILRQYENFKKSVKITKSFLTYIYKCVKDNIPYDDEKLIQHFLGLYKSNIKTSKNSITYFCSNMFIYICIFSQYKEIDLNFVIYFENALSAFYSSAGQTEIIQIEKIIDNYLLQKPCLDESNIECMKIINEFLLEKYEIEDFDGFIDCFVQFIDSSEEYASAFFDFVDYMKEINKFL